MKKMMMESKKTKLDRSVLEISRVVDTGVATLLHINYCYKNIKEIK